MLVCSFLVVIQKLVKGTLPSPCLMSQGRNPTSLLSSISKSWGTDNEPPLPRKVSTSCPCRSWPASTQKRAVFFLESKVMRRAPVSWVWTLPFWDWHNNRRSLLSHTAKWSVYVKGIPVTEFPRIWLWADKGAVFSPPRFHREGIIGKDG